jgi:phosphatidylethanolamine/phosphatidyl-N-methylethanolamine N-methyltransferase
LAHWAERALFFRHWLRGPLTIGAVLPSGRAVADAVVRALPPQAGFVLELGGGTGALTAALLEARGRADELLVVERAPALAVALRRRFPDLRVVEADARDIAGVLADLGISSLGSVVSSLPIKWFDVAGQRAVIDGCFARMAVGGAFIQLTNALTSPLSMRSLELEGRTVARIWMQVPPVQIWRYRRAGRARA